MDRPDHVGGLGLEEAGDIVVGGGAVGLEGEEIVAAAPDDGLGDGALGPLASTVTRAPVSSRRLLSSCARISPSRHDRHVDSRTERGGKVEHQRRYYLSSAKLNARNFAAAVRAHWGIENRLHWVLDVDFYDDLACLRTANGPQNMAVINHMAMNMVRAANDRHGLKVRRKKANLNPDYLEGLVRQEQMLT